MSDNYPELVGKIMAQGDPGDKGDPGVGVPPGGDVGQVLGKTGPGDYETGWVNQTGGGGGGGILQIPSEGMDHIDTFADAAGDPANASTFPSGVYNLGNGLWHNSKMNWAIIYRSGNDVSILVIQPNGRVSHLYSDGNLEEVISHGYSND